MEINLEVSEIINDDYSEFIDGNSQLCINEESFVSPLSHLQVNLNLPQDCTKGDIGSQILIKQNHVQQPQEQTKSEVSQTHIQITHIQPTQQQWQKVSFAKKRPAPNSASIQNVLVLNDSNQNQTANSNKQAKTLTSKILERTRSTLQQKQEEQISQVVLRKVQEDDIKSTKSKVQRAEERIGPLPVFDCLFCCQEHFVLFKTNEMILVKKYWKNHINDWRLQLPILDMALYNINKQQHTDSNKEENNEFQNNSPNFQIGSIEQNLQKLKSLAQFSTKQEKPKIRKVINLKKKLYLPLQQKPKVQILEQQQQQPQQQQKDHGQILQQNTMKQNIFDLLGQTIDESQFCVNLRTRRQKILQNISFESEVHNIYDPYFTSEEENDSMSQGEDINQSEDESESEVNSLDDQTSQSNSDSDCSNLSKTSISSIEKDEDEDNDEISSVEDEREVNEEIALQQRQSQQILVNNKEEDEDEEEGSERLTFGCITPQGDEDQKVTFSNYGEEPSLSPVRSNKNLTQEPIDDYCYKDLSPSHLKNALLLDHSPLSCQEVGSRRIVYHTDMMTNNIHEGAQCQSVIADQRRHLNFYPNVKQNDCVSENYQQQQQSYDTDLKIGHILSQISRPTEESKEPSTPSDSSSCEEEEESESLSAMIQPNQIVNSHLLSQLSYQPQSHSFTGATGSAQNHYKHQKLLNTNYNHLEQHIPTKSQMMTNLNIQQNMEFKLDNRDKINEMLKRTQLLQNKQLKHLGQQHFMSFDQINVAPFASKSGHNTEQQRNKKENLGVTHSMPMEADTIKSQQLMPENKTFDDILLSQRQAACSTNRAAGGILMPKGSDFTQMIDLSKLKCNLAKMTQNASGSKSVQVKTQKAKDSSTSKKLKHMTHAHQGSIIPKLMLSTQEDIARQIGQKGKIMISQRELNHLRSALCSSRYSTQAQIALNALSSYNLDDDTKSIKVKKQAHKKKQSKQSVQSNLQQQHGERKSESKLKSKKSKTNSSKKLKSKQKHQEEFVTLQMQNFVNTNASKSKKSENSQASNQGVGNLVQPEWYQPQIQNSMPVQFSQQQTTKNSMYMSIQDGKTFLNIPQSQHDTLNTEASSMLPNSLSKISYKRRPEKLNGSIEEVQNFLNSIEIKSNGCGSKKGSISLSRAIGKQSSSSITRQVADPCISNNPQSTFGQFSFSQNSVKLNLTANLSKSSKAGIHHKKKKSKLPPQSVINQQVNTTSSSQTFKNTSHHQFLKQQNKQRTRSTSKQSHHHQQQHPQSQKSNNGGGHQLLMTQQLSDQKKNHIIKSNQKICGQQESQGIKQKKKQMLQQHQNQQQQVSENSISNDKSHSQISSRKQLLVNHTKPSYGTSLFMLSQATSPLKIQNHLNFSSGMMRISQNHIPLQPSMSVKESIDLKKSLAKEYYEYLHLQKKQKQ